MRTLVVVLFAVAALGAQDVEPNFRRALAGVVRDLARDLPWRAPSARALRISAEDSGSLRAARSAAEALEGAGFRIVSGPDRTEGELDLVVGVGAAQGTKELRIRVQGLDEPFTARRGFGDAEWVDATAPRRTTEVGPDRATIAEARLAARDALHRRLEGKYPATAAARGRRALLVEPASEFVASATVESGRSYRVFLRTGDEEGLEREEARRAVAAARAPWIRAALAAAAALAATVAFKLLDWLTRGWRTRALRVVFGSLFAAALVGIWSATP